MIIRSEHHPVAVVALAAAVTSFYPGLQTALELQRSSLGDWQLWRLFTAHLTHCGFSHLFWDLVVFVALGLVIGSRLPPLWIWLQLAGQALAVSTAFLLFGPVEAVAYRGLSGIDSGFFALAMLFFWCEYSGWRRLVSLFMAGGFIIKTLWEVLVGAPVFVTQVDMIVVPVAHLAGVMAALAVESIRRTKVLQRLGVPAV